MLAMKRAAPQPPTLAVGPFCSTASTDMLAAALKMASPLGLCARVHCHSVAVALLSSQESLDQVAQGSAWEMGQSCRTQNLADAPSHVRPVCDDADGTEPMGGA